MSIVSKLAPLFAPNAYAVRYFDSRRKKWNYRKVARPLDDVEITRHISKGDPEFSVGAYVLRDLENSKGHALILDLDDHDGDAGTLITQAAVKFVAYLEQMGLPHLLFRSGGGKDTIFTCYSRSRTPKAGSALSADTLSVTTSVSKKGRRA